MKIQPAVKEDVFCIRNLWKVGFEEDDAFLDFYFPYFFEYDYTLVAKEGESIRASTTTIPHIMNFLSQNINATYIMGVVTHPNFRNKGMAASLLKESIQSQFERGYTVTTLIPAKPYLFDVYKKYGFTEVFYINEEEVFKNDLDVLHENNLYSFFTICESTDLNSNEVNKLFRFYSDVYNAQSCSILKTKKDFTFCLKEFLIFEGEIITIINEYKKICACAFITTKLNRVFIKELLFYDDKCKNIILRHICEKYNQHKILLKAPPKGGKHNKPLGMARVINAYDICCKLIKPQYCYGIKVTDPIIGQNNKVFLFKNGEVLTGTDKDVQNTLNINEFTTLALKYNFDIQSYCNGQNEIYGYLNLMLNE